MIKQNELTSKICIVGFGATGLRVVGTMAGQIQGVTCIGLEMGPTESPLPDSLIRLNIADKDNRLLCDLSPLFGFVEYGDLVFLVADLDEIPENELVQICNAAREQLIKLILVMPEPAAKCDRRGILVRKRNGEYVDYDAAFPKTALSVVYKLSAIIVVSKDSFIPLDQKPANALGSGAYMDYLICHAMEKLTDLVVNNSFTSISLKEIRYALRFKVYRIGTGIATGLNIGVIAAEAAFTCLNKQGVKRDRMESVLCIMSGSTGMTMDDFENVSSYIFSMIDVDATVNIGFVCDNSLGDNLMVTIMAGEAKLHDYIASRQPPSWVTMTDDNLRCIPAYERKKWFLDANDNKLG